MEYISSKKTLETSSSRENIQMNICTDNKVEDFIMVYLASIPEMFVLQGKLLKLLMAIWRLSSFNKSWCEEGNIFLNDQSTKEAINKMGLKMSNSSIDVGIHQITEKGFLIKLGKGKYLLNPKYFFKGTLSDRSHIRLAVEVDPVTKASTCFFMVPTPIPLDIDKLREE